MTDFANKLIINDENSESGEARTPKFKMAASVLTSAIMLGERTGGGEDERQGPTIVTNMILVCTVTE
jgi:hypothetical protein